MALVATIRIVPHFDLCINRSVTGAIICTISVPIKSNLPGNRIPTGADSVIAAIVASHHLIGPPNGPSIHFKMVLIISHSWVEMDSSAALALRGSLIVGLVTTTALLALVVVPLIVETLWRPLIVVLAASLITIVVVVVVAAVAATAAATTTLISSAATASSTATTSDPSFS